MIPFKIHTLFFGHIKLTSSYYKYGQTCVLLRLINMCLYIVCAEIFIGKHFYAHLK